MHNGYTKNQRLGYDQAVSEVEIPYKNYCWVTVMDSGGSSGGW